MQTAFSLTIKSEARAREFDAEIAVLRPDRRTSVRRGVKTAIANKYIHWEKTKFSTLKSKSKGALRLR